MFTIDTSTGYITLKTEYVASTGNIYVPEYIDDTKVTGIADSGLSGAKLSTITFIKPENITYIGANAFEQCTNLSSFEVPEKVKEIKSFAFKDCSSLTQVSFKNTKYWCQGDNVIDVTNPNNNATNLKNIGDTGSNWGKTGIVSEATINVSYSDNATFKEEDGYNPRKIKTTAKSINIKYTDAYESNYFSVTVYQNHNKIADVTDWHSWSSSGTITVNFDKELDNEHDIYVQLTIFW